MAGSFLMEVLDFHCYLIIWHTNMKEVERKRWGPHKEHIMTSSWRSTESLFVLVLGELKIKCPFILLKARTDAGTQTSTHTTAWTKVYIHTVSHLKTYIYACKSHIDKGPHVILQIYKKNCSKILWGQIKVFIEVTDPLYYISLISCG